MARSTLREDEVRTLATLEGVPPELALAVWAQESSSGRNAKTSGKGARGDFQLLPATFKAYMPGGDINDPTDNAMAGIRYLKDLMGRYKDPEMAAQAYYGGRPVGVGGKRDVDSGPGTPTISQYGKEVVGRMQQFLPTGGQTYEGVATPTEPTDWESMMPPGIGLGASLGSFDPNAPQESPLMGLYAHAAGMYGVDPESGLSNDIATGMRDAGTQFASAGSSDLDSYLQGLVDKTLQGQNFG